MRRMLRPLAAATALAVLVVSPASAATFTRSLTLGNTTLSCVTTYTELNNNDRIDTLAELRSITSIVCTVTRT